MMVDKACAAALALQAGRRSPALFVRLFLLDIMIVTPSLGGDAECFSVTRIASTFPPHKSAGK